MAEILVIEDDSDLVETYTDVLERRGHSVVHASQLSKATDLLHNIPPEIITLDLHLPGSSNATITNFLSLAKKLCKSKIIVISGHPEMMDVDWMDYTDLVLTKPVDNNHLIMMISRLLS
jgi:two-component system phosphoglycerate transport system response regulator PgtA